MLYEPECIVLIPNLRPEHFYRTTHREIFSNMSSLFSEQKTFDEVTLAAALKKSGSQINTVSDLYKIKNAVPSSAMVLHHSAMITQIAMARNAIAIGERLARDAMEGDSADAVAKAEIALKDVGKSAGFAEPISLGDALKEALETENAAAHPTGSEDLDKALGGGLHYGGTLLLGGDSKAGKTVLAMGMINAAITFGTPVYIVSRDQTYKDVALRIYTARAKVHKDKIRDSLLADKIRPEIDSAKTSFHDEEFDLRTICRQIRLAAKLKGVKIWVLDFMQRILVPEMKGAKEHERSVAIADALSDLAQDTETAGVVISRVNKPGEGSFGTQHRFSGGAGVQNSSDGMIFVHLMERENSDLYDAFHPEALRTIEIINGRYYGASVVTMKLVGFQDRFVDQSVSPMDDDQAWTLAQNDAWSQYRSSKKKRRR